MTITARLRWDVVQRLLPERASRVLDIGAGTGAIGAMLARRFEYVGIEPDAISFRAAQAAVGGLGTVLNCGYEELTAAEDFDLVCAFEVLEHIPDDRSALSSWTKHLRPGGSLLLSVPRAARGLPADARVGDLRRYDDSELRSLMTGVGLQDVVAQVYGSPYGNVRETLINVFVRRDIDEASLARRTAASARSMQPHGSLAYLVAGAAAPLRLLQRPFAGLGIGTGLVCRGDKGAQLR